MRTQPIMKVRFDASVLVGTFRDMRAAALGPFKSSDDGRRTKINKNAIWKISRFANKEKSATRRAEERNFVGLEFEM